MDFQFYQSRIKKLLRSRQIAWRINLGLMSIIFLMLGVIYFLIGHTRTIIIPATLSEPIWIESNRVSNSYLAEMGVLLVNQYLTVSSETVGLQKNLLMQHIAPEASGHWQKILVTLEEKLKRDDIAMVFFIKQVAVENKKLMVRIGGELQMLIHDTALPKKSITYELKFILRSGRLWLQSMEEMK